MVQIPRRELPGEAPAPSPSERWEWVVEVATGRIHRRAVHDPRGCEGERRGDPDERSDDTIGAQQSLRGNEGR